MKKEKKLIIIIVLLVILLAGSIGFICYDKFIANDNKNKEEIKEENNKNDESLEEEKERKLTYDELSILKTKIDLLQEEVKKLSESNLGDKELLEAQLEIILSKLN